MASVWRWSLRLASPLSYDEGMIRVCVSLIIWSFIWIVGVWSLLLMLKLTDGVIRGTIRSISAGGGIQHNRESEPKIPDFRLTREQKNWRR